MAFDEGPFMRIRDLGGPFVAMRLRYHTTDVSSFGPQPCDPPGSCFADEDAFTHTLADLQPSWTGEFGESVTIEEYDPSACEIIPGLITVDGARPELGTTLVPHDPLNVVPFAVGGWRALGSWMGLPETSDEWICPGYYRILDQAVRGRPVIGTACNFRGTRIYVATGDTACEIDGGPIRRETQYRFSPIGHRFELTNGTVDPPEWEGILEVVAARDTGDETVHQSREYELICRRVEPEQ